ncbi:putative motility protein YjfB-like [Pseudoduganella flava]|uniref:Motility protein n=1 Tax=Pseudoduganella flava TaxID=871742 RepID=A0A562Q4G2_9BURK|nr:YjfB family protein [Pseudoduganella flava]QGZ41650.1 putative motility protein [Pseudoduganella flava]TWI51641.1 putative motility protein YjfB-like [Pseudoduganella flava]
MDAMSIARLSTTIAETGTREEVSMAVLKKAMDAQASSAAALIDALPPVQSTNLPPHLGNHVNTTA